MRKGGGGEIVYFMTTGRYPAKDELKCDYSPEYTQCINRHILRLCAEPTHSSWSLVILDRKENKNLPVWAGSAMFLGGPQL